MNPHTLSYSSPRMRGARASYARMVRAFTANASACRRRDTIRGRPTLFDDILGTPVPTLHRAGAEQRAALESSQQKPDNDHQEQQP